MRITILLIAALVCSTAASAQVSTTKQIKKTVPSFLRGTALPKWTQPLAEIPNTTRDEPIVIRLNETQSWVGVTPAYLINKVVQVNEKNAVNQIGQFGISYYPSYQQLNLHRLQIIRDGKTIDHTTTVNIRHLQRETSMEQGMYGGATTVQFLLDDVRIGDSLILTFSVTGENPVFDKKWTSEFEWDSDAPVERRRVSIMHPKNRSLYWQQLGDFKKTEIKPTFEIIGDIEKIQFEENKLESIDREPSIPSRYFPNRLLQFSEYKNWQEVSNWASNLFPKVKPSIELQKLAQQFKQKNSTIEQVSAALHWVQDEVRYFSVSIGENSHKPQAPDIVIKRRYGDCKDKSYLLITLLQELGYEAYPVLLSARSSKAAEKSIASPSVFDHVIVAIKLGGKSYFVDPTQTGQKVAVDKIAAPFPGARVLLAQPSTNNLVTLPEREKNLVLAEQNIQIQIPDVNSDANIDYQYVYRGAYAEWARQVYDGLSQKDKKKSVLMQLEKIYPNIVMDTNVILVNRLENNEFEVQAKMRIPNPFTQKEGKYFLAYESNIFQGVLGIPEKVNRNFPFELPTLNYRGQFNFSITWPEMIRNSSGPTKRAIENEFFTATEEVTEFGNKTNIFTDFKIHRNELAANELLQLQAQTRKIATFGHGEVGFDGKRLKAKAYTNLTQRELATLQIGAALSLMGNNIEVPNDNEDALYEICNTIAASPFLSVFFEEDGPIEQVRVERFLRAQKTDAPLKRCLSKVLLAGGKYKEANEIFLADKSLKNTDRRKKDFAWASYFAGNAKLAEQQIQEFLQAKKADSLNTANLFDLADIISLYHRIGIDTTPLKLDFEGYNRTHAWPYPIVQMLLGTISPNELIKRINTLPQASREIAASDTWYYIAQSHLAVGKYDEALDALNKVINRGIPVSSNYHMANIERNRILNTNTDYILAKQLLAEGEIAKAVKLFRTSAAANFTNSLYELGKVYYYGDYDDTKKDLKEALRLFEKAANQGHPGAANFVANMLYDGEGVNLNRLLAIEWYKKAAMLGDRHGAHNLAKKYMEGTVVAKDETAALHNFTIAAEQGHEKAQVELAKMFANSKSPFFNVAEAFRWSILSSIRGNMVGMQQLAALYATANDIEQNGKRAIEIYEGLVTKGDIQSMFNLGSMYKNGIGIEVDNPRAFDWFNRAVDKGHIEAIVELGSMYQKGLGTEIRTDKAISLFERASNFGSGNANLQLAHTYFQGIGVTKDIDKASQYLLIAEEKGNSEAQEMIQKADPELSSAIEKQRQIREEKYTAPNAKAEDIFNLGAKYYYGRGVAKNYALAFKWYKLAADKQLPIAQNNLGDMYEIGAGIPTNIQKAIELYKLAAQAGNDSGLLSLATLYERGLGFPQDYFMAYVYYQMAAAVNSNMKNRGTQSAEKLTSEEINRANRIASGWKKTMPLPVRENITN